MAPNTDSATIAKDKFQIEEFGILYPTGNVQELSNSILCLIEYNNIKIDLRNKKNTRAKDFSLEKIIIQYKKVLEIE